MTEKEMKRLSRADLLEMLIDQSVKLQEVQSKLKEVESALEEAEAALQKRDLAINKAGSIAEAALQLGGVFEAAEASGQQYLNNIKLLSERQEAVCAQMEQESQEKADRLIAEAEKRCAEMEEAASVRCGEMEQKAKAESQAYWDEVAAKLEAFYTEYTGLREMLSMPLVKRD